MPRYQHDCKHCESLGEHAEYDLYFCATRIPTVIARWSDEGRDYKSGLAPELSDPDLAEAKKRAVDRGLLAA